MRSAHRAGVLDAGRVKGRGWMKTCTGQGFVSQEKMTSITVAVPGNDYAAFREESHSRDPQQYQTLVQEESGRTRGSARVHDCPEEAQTAISKCRRGGQAGRLRSRSKLARSPEPWPGTGRSTVTSAKFRGRQSRLDAKCSESFTHESLNRNR